LVDLEFGGGNPDFKAPGDRITRGTNMRRVHDPPNLDIEVTPGNGASGLLMN
jgi:hypothetical protein